MGVLRDLVRLPDVRRIEVAWALSVLGWTSTAVAILVFAYLEGGTPLVAVYSVGRALSGTAGSMLVSSLADRMPRERLLLLTTVARTLLTGAGGWLAMSGGPAAAVVALVLVADGLAATFRPLQAAALPWLVQTPAQLATANVAATLMENTGSLIGPALAGLTLAVADAPVALAMSAAFPLFATLTLVRLRMPEEARSEPTGSPRLVRDLTSGVSTLFRLPPTGGFVVLVVVQTFARGALMVGLVALAYDELGLGGQAVGTLNAVMGLGGLLGGLIGVRLLRTTNLGRSFTCGVVGWGVALTLLALWPVVGISFAALMLLGVSNAFEDASCFTLIARLATGISVARAMGAIELLVVVCGGIGSLAVTVLINVYDVRVALGVVGAVALLPALVYAVPFRRLDRSLPAPGPEVELLRGLPMFAGLPMPVVDQLAAELEPRHYAAQAVLFGQGDPGSMFHVIASGRADVVVDHEPRPALGPGDCFGEIALLRDGTRTATITARTDLTTYTLPREAFLRAVLGNRSSHNFATALADRRFGAGTAR